MPRVVSTFDWLPPLADPLQCAALCAPVESAVAAHAGLWASGGVQVALGRVRRVRVPRPVTATSRAVAQERAHDVGATAGTRERRRVTDLRL